MDSQKQYYFTPKGDHLTLFKGKKKLHTPKGNVVIAYSQQLAERIIAELEAEEDYTSCSNLLCYHYTFCDLIAEFDVQSIQEDLVACIQANVDDDPLLPFGNAGCEDYETLAITTTEELKAHAQQCNIYQLTAIIVLFCACESILLPWIILKNADSAETLVRHLKLFCKEEEITLPHDMETIISKFEYYYNLK